MSYVLGIDPGGTTGLAMIREGNPRTAFEVCYLREVEGGIDGFLEAWYGMEDWPSSIVVESFALDGRTPRPDLTPVEIIGALKGWGSTRDAACSKLVFQTNTQGKHLMSNDILKRAGYYPKRGSVGGGHAVDALRHALTYATVTLKHRPTRELLWPRED